MKKKNRATRPRRFGCLRRMLMLSIAFVSVSSTCWVTSHLYYSVPVQKFLYRVQQVTNTAVPVAKESDMIAFYCVGGRIYTVHPDGSHLRKVGDGYLAGNDRDIAWSPNGTWIAVTLSSMFAWQSSEVFNIRFDGSQSRRLTFNHTEEEYVSWSRDGTAIYYVSGGANYLVAADGSETRRISDVGPTSGAFNSLEQSLAGQWLEEKEGSSMESSATIQDLDSGESGLTGKHTIMASRLNTVWAPGRERVALSKYDELRVFNVKTQSDDYILKLQASSPTWSPDGRWIAMSAFEGSAHAQHSLQVFDTETGDIQHLIYGRGFGPTWSPDSEWIAFGHDALPGYNNDYQLFKIRRDGSALQQLTDLNCHVTTARWSSK